MATARTEGARDAVARISAILDSDAAKARPASAHTMAFNADMAAMSADAVIGLLGGLPEEASSSPAPKADASKPGFAELMAGTPNPDISATSGDTPPAADEADEALADLAALTGRTFK